MAQPILPQVIHFEGSHSLILHNSQPELVEEFLLAAQRDGVAMFGDIQDKQDEGSLSCRLFSVLGKNEQGQLICRIVSETLHFPHPNEEQMAGLENGFCCYTITGDFHHLVEQQEVVLQDLSRHNNGESPHTIIFPTRDGLPQDLATFLDQEELDIRSKINNYVERLNARMHQQISEGRLIAQVLDGENIEGPSLADRRIGIQELANENPIQALHNAFLLVIPLQSKFSDNQPIEPLDPGVVALQQNSDRWWASMKQSCRYAEFYVQQRRNELCLQGVPQGSYLFGSPLRLMHLCSNLFRQHIGYIGIEVEIGSLH